MDYISLLTLVLIAQAILRFSFCRPLCTLVNHIYLLTTYLLKHKATYDSVVWNELSSESRCCDGATLLPRYLGSSADFCNVQHSTSTSFTARAGNFLPRSSHIVRLCSMMPHCSKRPCGLTLTEYMYHWYSTP